MEHLAQSATRAWASGEGRGEAFTHCVPREWPGQRVRRAVRSWTTVGALGPCHNACAALSGFQVQCAANGRDWGRSMELSRRTRELSHSRARRVTSMLRRGKPPRCSLTYQGAGLQRKSLEGAQGVHRSRESRRLSALTATVPKSVPNGATKPHKRLRKARLFEFCIVHYHYERVRFLRRQPNRLRSGLDVQR